MHVSVALFLFAHQDDEFGVFHRIGQCVREGLRVHCAYLTDGAYRRATPQERNAESLAVLARLGVRSGDVAFAGAEIGISDGSLPEHLPAARAWLQAWLARFTAIDSIHVPAWEGGHQDHDALHALGVVLARDNGMLERVRQYPLYHANGCTHPMLRALAPLEANGPVWSTSISRRERLRHLKLCLSYPSQRNAWALLFPFVAMHYAVRGTQQLQGVSLERLTEKPHAGALYYERRGFYDWERMRERVQALLSPGSVPAELGAPGMSPAVQRQS